MKCHVVMQKRKAAAECYCVCLTPLPAHCATGKGEQMVVLLAQPHFPRYHVLQTGKGFPCGQSCSAQVITERWKHTTSSGAVRCTPDSIKAAVISPEFPVGATWVPALYVVRPRGRWATPCLWQTGPVPSSESCKRQKDQQGTPEGFKFVH